MHLQICYYFTLTGIAITKKDETISTGTNKASTRVTAYLRATSIVKATFTNNYMSLVR